MAKASQDPPSPVDAYEAPPLPTAAGSPPPPPPPPPFYGQGAYAQPGYTQPAYGQAGYAAPQRETNVLAIIALVASGAGILIPGAVVAGIIMGYIALGQIKRTGQGGHGLALGAVIAGWVIFAIEVLVVVAYVFFLFWIIGTASSASNDFNFSDFG